MDPRIRRRRVEVRREEGRRRFRVLLGVTAVVAAGCVGWAANGSALLDLDRIVVVDAVHTAPDDARFASGLRRGEPLSGVDQAAAARAVETLPWVADAVVVRAVARRGPDPPGRAAGRGRGAAPRTAVPPSSTAPVGSSSGSPVAPPELAVLAGLPPAGPPGTTLAARGGGRPLGGRRPAGRAAGPHRRRGARPRAAGERSISG